MAHGACLSRSLGVESVDERLFISFYSFILQQNITLCSPAEFGRILGGPGT